MMEELVHEYTSTLLHPVWELQKSCTSVLPEVRSETFSVGLSIVPQPY